MADFILHMPPRFFARVFGNPAGDPVLLKSRGVTLLRDKPSKLNFLCTLSLVNSKTPRTSSGLLLRRPRLEPLCETYRGPVGHGVA